MRQTALSDLRYKGAGQHAHLCSLPNAFVVRKLYSIII